jgi:polar amino acid transport system permease protein
MRDGCRRFDQQKSRPPMTAFSPPTADARPAPGRYKRNLIIARLARLPWWVLLAALLILAFAFAVAPDPTYQRVWAEVQQGIGVTLFVTFVAYACSLVLGLVLALLRRSKHIVVYQLVTLYVEVVRGIPTLVLVYYVVLAAAPAAVQAVASLGAWMVANGVFTGLGAALAELTTRDVSNVARAIIGLTISYSAFLSEVFRAGIDSIEYGQHEAGTSLGMTRWQVMRLIILPQALRNILPPLANDFIAMLKESSLVSIVGVNDITRQGATFASANFVFFQSYNVIALTYLVLTLSLSLAVKVLERWLDRSRRQRG